MCGPLALPALALGGSLLQAYGTIQNSQAQASALKRNAQADITQGYQNELDARDKARSALADQLSALGGRGVSLDTGTPLDLLRASARNQEIDALRIRAEGINKYNSQRAQASATLRTGWLTAGGQILMGAANAGGLAGLGSIGAAAPATTSFAGADSFASFA